MLRKLTSALLISAFLCLDLVPDAGLRLAYAEETHPSHPANDLHNIVLDNNLGLIQTKSRGKSGLFIILIQDLHCVSEAQKSIGMIIQYLSNKHAISDIFLEGAAGGVNPHFLSAFPDQNLRKDLSESLLSEGSLSGAEWAGSDPKSSIELWGAEDPQRYQKNLDAFIAARNFKADAMVFCETLKEKIQEEKLKNLSTNLFQIDEAYWNYREGKGELQSFLPALIKETKAGNLPVPKSLRVYDLLEKRGKHLNGEKLNAELSALAETISKRGSRESVSQLIQSVLKYRIGKISDQEFFENLRNIMKRHEIKLIYYPQIKAYNRILILRSRIDSLELDADIEGLVRDILSKQGSWFEDTRLLLQLKELLSLQLSSSHWDEFKSTVQQERLKAFLQKYRADQILPSDDHLLESWKIKAGRFYESAEKRNESLVDRTVSKMLEKKVSSGILVAGGFHTSGIADRLRKLGISFCVIVPKVRHIDVSNYEKRLTAEPLGLEMILLNMQTSQPVGAFPEIYHSLAPSLRSALVPLSFPWLRQLLMEKSYLLYSLLAFWESGQKPADTVIAEARKSFLNTLSADERKVMEQFLNSVKMGRVEGAKDQVWIQGKIGNQEWLFHLGKNLTASSDASSETTFTEGILKVAGKISFKVFKGTQGSFLRDAAQRLISSKFLSPLVTRFKPVLDSLRPWFNNRFSLAGMAGIVSAAGFVVLYVYAMIKNPGFHLGGNFLSELGIGPVSWPFNLASLISGVFLSFFGWFSLKPVLEDGLVTKVGLAMMTLSGVFLAGIGIFTMSWGVIHGIVALLFFTSISGALLFLLRPMMKSSVFGPLISIPVSVSVGLSMGFLVTLSPVVETAAILAHFLGVVFTSVRLVNLGRAMYPSLKEPAAPSSQMNFTEVMSEFPDSPDGVRVDLSLNVKDMDLFILDPDHTVELDGAISGGPWKQKIPLDHGSLQLFRKNPERGRLELVYRMTFHVEGVEYQLEGIKTLEDHLLGMDFIRDMTQLQTKIWKTEGGAKTLAWQGQLRFSLLDLPSFLENMAFTTEEGSPSWKARLKFVRFVSNNILQAYMPTPQKIMGTGYAGKKPDLNKIRLSSDRSLLASEPFDVVVIGSGYGASVVALRLAQAGQRVAILERGREVPVGDFPDTLQALMKEIRGFPDIHFHLPGPGRPELVAGLSWNRLGLLDFRLDTHHPEGIHVLVGQGLGGTSLINSNVMERPEDKVFEDSHWPPEIARELGPYFETATRMLDVNKVSDSRLLAPGELPKKTLALFKGADPLAEKRLAAIAVNFNPAKPFLLPGFPVQPACTLCGDCFSGCNVGAKNTLMMNYLPAAYNAGAKIFTQVEVSYLERDSSGGYRIRYYHADELDQKGKEAPLRVIHAPKVVIAAGALGSAEILLRSKKENPSFAVSPQLGERFSSNADFSGVGYNMREATHTLGFGTREDERSRAPVGPIITGMIDLKAKAKPGETPFIIEEGAFPRALVDVLRYAMALGLIEGVDSDQDLMDKLKRIKRIGLDLLPGYSADGALNHSILYLTIGHDSSGGRLILDKEGKFRVDWPDAGKQKVFKRMTEEHRAMTHRLGGTHVKKPLNQAITVHPLGGVPMGRTRKEGAVNHRGQVFDSSGKTTDAVFEGLYVVDGSVIPTSLGVNPALTIAALAERTAAKIIENDLGVKPLLESLTENPEGYTDERLKSVFKGMGFTLEQVNEKWPDAIPVLRKILYGWVSGKTGPGFDLKSIPLRALKQMSQMGRTFPAFPEKRPIIATLDRLIALITDPAKAQEKEKVNIVDLGLRAMSAFNAIQWAPFVLYLDFQYDFPLFDAAVLDEPEAFAKSFSYWSVRDPKLNDRLASFLMTSKLNHDQKLRFLMALDTSVMEKFVWEMMAGGGSTAIYTYMRELATGMLLELSRRMNRSSLELMKDQAGRIEQLKSSYTYWLRWIPEVVSALNGEAGPHEALAQELHRLQSQLSPSKQKPLFDLSQAAIKAVSAVPVTSAMVLTPSIDGPQEVGWGRIYGDKIDLHGLTGEERNLLEEHLKVFLETYQGFDFSNVWIRIVEGSTRFADLDSETITLDRRALKHKYILGLELTHEIQEFLLANSKLRLLEPAQREAVVLSMEIDLFETYPVHIQAEVLKDLLNNPDLDHGRFSHLLYSTLGREMREQINSILKKDLTEDVIKSLDQLEIRLTEEEKIQGIAQYLDQTIYHDMIRREVHDDPDRFVQDVAKDRGRFITHLLVHQRFFLSTQIKKWIHERLPSATDTDMKKWVRVLDEEVEKMEERNDQNMRFGHKNFLIPILGMVLLTVLGKSLFVFSSPIVLSAFIVMIAAGAVWLSLPIIKNLSREFQWRLNPKPPAIYDPNEKAILINPLASERAVRRYFKKALNDLAQDVEKDEQNRMLLAEQDFASLVGANIQSGAKPSWVEYPGLPFALPRGLGEVVIAGDRILWRKKANQVVGFDSKLGRFFTVVAMSVGMKLRASTEEEKERLQEAVYYDSALAETSLGKFLLDTSTRGSQTLKKTTNYFRVLAEGKRVRSEVVFDLKKSRERDHAQIQKWEVLLNQVVSEFTRAYAAIPWEGIQFRIVEGNDRLAHLSYEGYKKTITIDADAFKSKALLRLEVVHELVHLVLREIPRVIPKAMEEVIVIRYITDLFRELLVEDQIDVLKTLREDADLDSFASWKLYYLRLGSKKRTEIVDRLKDDPVWVKELDEIKRYTIQGLDEAIINYICMKSPDDKGTYPGYMRHYLTERLGADGKKQGRPREEVLTELAEYRIPISEIFSIMNDIRDLILQLKDQATFLKSRWQLLRKTILLLDKVNQIYGIEGKTLSLRIANAAMINTKKMEDPKAFLYLLRQYQKILARYSGRLEPIDYEVRELVENMQWLMERLPEEHANLKEAAYLSLVHLYLSKARFKDALEPGIKALKEFPRNVGLLLAVGLASQNSGGVKNAYGFYEQALSVDPWNTTAHDRLAGLYETENKFSWSIAHKARALVIARRVQFGFTTFKSLEEASIALAGAIGAHPGAVQEIVKVWAKAVFDDGLFREQEGFRLQDPTLLKWGSLLRAELMNRVMEGVQTEVDWLADLLAPLRNRVDPQYAVPLGMRQLDWEALRQKARNLLSAAGGLMPENVTSLVQRPDAQVLWQKLLALGGPKALSGQIADDLRKHMIEYLAKGEIKPTRIAEHIEMLDAYQDNLPSWVRALTPVSTSAFKTGVFSFDHEIVDRGKFIKGSFVFKNVKNPMLEHTLEKFVSALGRQIDFRKMSIRIVKSKGELAWIDLEANVLYLDDRLLDHEGLLNLELAEEMAHVLIRDRKKSIGQPWSLGFEEVSAIAYKVRYFEKMDPVLQSEILLFLYQHRAWDRGRFGDILVGILDENAKTAVKNAAAIKFGEQIPNKWLRKSLERSKLAEYLVQYILSIDIDGFPVFESRVTDPMSEFGIEREAEGFLERVQQEFESSGVKFPAEKESRLELRRGFLLDAESSMGAAERESVLTGIFLSTLMKFPLFPPSQRDWIEAYVDFILPSLDVRIGLEAAAISFKDKLLKVEREDDVLPVWRGLISAQRHLGSISEQEARVLMRVENLSIIMMEAMQVLGRRYPAAELNLLSKMLLYVEQFARHCETQDVRKLSDLDRWILDAFLTVMTQSSFTRFQTAVSTLYKTRDEFVHSLNLLARFGIQSANTLKIKLIHVDKNISGLQDEEPETGDLPKVEDTKVDYHQNGEAYVQLILDRGFSVMIDVNWSSDISANEVIRWLLPLLKVDSLLRQFGLDASKLKAMRIDNLSSVLMDYTQGWANGVRHTPYLISFQVGDQWIQSVVNINREFDAQAFVKEQPLVIHSFIGDRSLWKSSYTYTAYDIEKAMTLSVYSQSDHERFRVFLSNKMVEHVVHLASQLLDYEYYGGRVASFGKKAFYWGLKPKPQGQELFDTFVSYSPEQYEQIKMELLEEMRKRESAKWAPFARQGLTWDQLKMTAVDQLSEILLLFSLDPRTSFNQIKTQPSIAALYTGWLSRWGSEMGAKKIRTDAFDWIEHWKKFDSFILWLWPVNPDGALELVEQILDQVDSGLQVRSMPDFIMDPSGQRDVAVLHPIYKDMLVDRSGMIRSDFALRFLSKIPEQILRDVIPLLSEERRHALERTGGLLQALGQEESGERIRKLAVAGLLMRPPLWRAIEDLFYSALQIKGLKSQFSLNGVLDRMVRHLGIPFDKNLRIDPLPHELLLLRSEERHLLEEGYALGRFYHVQPGIWFYEAKSRDDENVLIQIKFLQKNLIEPGRPSSAYLPDVTERYTEQAMTRAANAPHVSVDVYKWTRVSRLEDWIRRRPLTVAEGIEYLKVLTQLIQLFQENIQTKINKEITSLWVTYDGKVLVHPALWPDSTNVSMSDMKQDLLSAMKSSLNVFAESISYLLKQTLGASPGPGWMSLFDQQLRNKILWIQSQLDSQADLQSRLKSVDAHVRDVLQDLEDVQRNALSPSESFPDLKPTLLLPERTEERRVFDQAA